MLLNILWPDTETEQGRKIAILYGTIGLAVVGLSMMYKAFKELFPERSIGGVYATVDQRVVAFIIGVMFAMVFVVLALRLWRKHSLFAASVGLVLRTFDAAYALRDNYFVAVLVWVLMLLFSIHGVRGVQGMRRHKARLREHQELARLQSARNAIASLR
jgi:succinate dehydrogenase/fumarate reductase cytochrome b subunit